MVPQLVRQLVYYYFYEKYQVPLHLWWTETFLKLWKVPNYYVQDCRSELFPWAHWLMLYSMFSLLFSRCAWSMIYHVLYTYNHGHNIWNKVKKSSKIEQEQKSLMTASAKFLTAIAKILFVTGRLDTRPYLHPILKFF